MDDLLARLRAAKPEARDQRDRRRRARLKDKHAVRIASGQKIPDVNATGKIAESPTTDGLLSPNSELSESATPSERGDGASEGEDVADRAANMLQDLGGASDDEESVTATGPDRTSSSLRVRRRRENAEEERARRRERRKQARSEISSTVSGRGSVIEDEDGEKERVVSGGTDDDIQEDPVVVSPTKKAPGVVVEPPSPKGWT